MTGGNRPALKALVGNTTTPLSFTVDGRTAFIAWTASARGNAPVATTAAALKVGDSGAPAHPRSPRRAAREPAAQPGALGQRLRRRPGRRRPDVRVPGSRAGRRHDRQDDHDRHPPRQLERAERAARPAEHARRSTTTPPRSSSPGTGARRTPSTRPRSRPATRSRCAPAPTWNTPLATLAAARRCGRSTTTSRSHRSTPTAGTCRSTARPCSRSSLLDPAASCGRVCFT